MSGWPVPEKEMELRSLTAKSESTWFCVILPVPVLGLVMKGGQIATNSSFTDGDFLARSWNAVDHTHVALNPFQ